MLPWNPPASLSMQHGQGGGMGMQNELHSVGMQHQQGGAGGQFHQQQQGQGQQQQQQPSQQQQPHQQGAASMNANGLQSPAQPPLSLSQVLHFLQTEWRRYERERNEWEIERGEMRARIALLEGERRGTENLKTDLMRRVKMLEYALRTERGKYLTTANQQHSINKEKEVQAPKPQEEKEKEGSVDAEKEQQTAGKEAEDKEKPSAIPGEKRKSLREQSGLPQPGSTAPGRASPVPTVASDDGAVGGTVPDLVISNANQAASAAGAAGSAQQLAGFQRISSTTSLSSLPNGQNSVNIGGAGTMNLGPLSWNPSLGRDPRGRAKSREYLKQCLQEITYLTSATALNPLPERTPAGMLRPRKHMVDVPAPSQAAVPALQPIAQGGHVQTTASAVPEIQQVGSNNVISLPGAGPLAGASAAPITGTQVNLAAETETIASKSPSTDATALDTLSSTPASGPLDLASSSSEITAPKLSPLVPQTAADVFSALPLGPASDESDVEDSATMTTDAAARLTAIFRPESSEEWKKALQNAGQQNKPQPNGLASLNGETEKAPGTIVTLKEAQEQAAKAKDTAAAPVSNPVNRARSDTVQSSATVTGDYEDEHKTWRPRRTLRAHLDGARCLAFDRCERTEDVTFATGSDDCTVKLWRVPSQSLSAVNRSQHLSDSEPAITYRGHTAPVTSLYLSSSMATNRVYSASLDSSIQVWSMPPKERDTYAPFDQTLNVARLEGHTDGVWDVCLLSAAGSRAANGISTTPWADSDKEILASASADGTVKIWDVSPTSEDGKIASSAGGALRLSWTAAGTDSAVENASGTLPAPTSLALCQTDMTKLAVAYQDGRIRLFDAETGKLVLTLQHSDSANAQINRIVSHPTLPMVIAGSEDKHIRLYDLKSGQCTYSLVGHTDAVTSIDVDPSGLTIASASHDCTLRFWDLLQTRSCIQEISNSHRTKGDEGVLDVKYHPTLPFVASAGADGGFRLYG